MKVRILLSAVLFAAAFRALAADEEEFDLSDSIVGLEINRLQYNYYQPWSSQSASYRKSAVVLSKRELLTTADWLQESTLVRAQKGGRGAWYDAKIAWIDFHANLAILTVASDDFWKGLQPMPMVEKVPTRGSVQIHRWNEGGLQNWRGEVSKVFVQKSQRSYVKYLQMEITSDVNAAGWSEVVVRGGSMLGLVAAQEGNRLWVIPTPIVSQLLKARGKNGLGLSYFDFGWEYTRNAALARYLGLEGPTRGILITSMPRFSAFRDALQAHDLVLEIDGFPIDSSGDYQDPEYGFLSFHNLATRHKLAGQPVRFKVWRNRKLLEVSAKMPAADFNADLVPKSLPDHPPEYVIAGGLVFEPLTVPYLQSWGGRWWESAPFRLYYFSTMEKTDLDPGVVILSTVLPDAFNIGYQDYSFVPVERINGRHITQIADVLEAFKRPQGEFHVIEFQKNKEIQRLVLDASDCAAATQRVLDLYGIPKDHFIAEAPAPTPAPAAKPAPPAPSEKQKKG
ncbi:MAG: hypothetical protein JO317_00895 [Verrucomicrobiae bacterium]|nr:hypothetical protein [Verrucomicrobiae bacterium]